MTTTATRTVLSLHDVTVTYPDGGQSVAALDHVDFTACAGELTAVIGESGSGKSTLLTVAAGLTAPDSGTVDVADGGTGMVFQSPNLLASLTVREQLLVTDHIRGTRANRERRRHADGLLTRVGLEGLGDRRTHQLSGGQRQRVNIARALTGDPGLLLADEPTSALDHALSRRIVELLRELTSERGLATVLVTHDRSLLDVADRVVEMRDGRVVG
ncbi:ABC transporter ATP-binding protein [Corynebacterium sp.]|uniref:ABC transporter ATP-binding protein n=1 Tax=Corynebacterium sp. TaxID=1720 RepID=UPI0025BF889B|nr:ABC transporter ATP-binding protein [Corynebacterium sp.]